LGKRTAVEVQFDLSRRIAQSAEQRNRKPRT
jgi:hypothetical protein